MAIKKVLIPGIGEVVLAKRRGTTHLRLSITAKGIVRVGLPYWTPYSVGISFAKQRADWINKHLAGHQVSDFKSGDRIGKSHVIEFNFDPRAIRPSSRIAGSVVTVNSPLPIDNEQTQGKIIEAAARALKKEAETLLPQRLEHLAQQHDYQYTDVKIRSLTSRWGSCSSKQVITLSYFLIQLPWNLIDYVLVHELVHTKHMNHSPAFWNEFERIMPGARTLRKQVNAHKPRVMRGSLD